jgi:hypothetical protein
MNNKNVLIGLAVTGALAVSGYSLFDSTKKIEKLEGQLSKLNRDHVRSVKDINELIETYDAVNNSLTYNEAGISIAMEDIAKQEDILTSLTVNDSILLDEINDVKAGQDEQAKELLAVKELATAVPIVPQPIVEVVTAPVVVVEPEPEPEPVVVVAPEPEPEPVVYFCPKPDSGVNFGKYISRLSFNKAVKFTVSFDIQDGTVANVSFTPEVTKKLNRAVSRYLNDSIIPINNVTDCSLPFTIAV